MRIWCKLAKFFWLAPPFSFLAVLINVNLSFKYFSQYFQAPVLFRGIGHMANPSNSLVRTLNCEQWYLHVQLLVALLCFIAVRHVPFMLFFYNPPFSPVFGHSQVLKVLSASPSAYSANPKTKLSSPPSLTGSAISLVSVMQVIEFVFTCLLLVVACIH